VFVDEWRLIDAARSLLSDRLVEVREVGASLEPVPVPARRGDEASPRHYRFRPTDAGEGMWGRATTS
jgi:hypothetical protein